jgi:hypothetical protein
MITPDPKRDDDPSSEPANGPQLDGVDEAAGGADSSPHETEPSDERTDGDEQLSQRERQSDE